VFREAWPQAPALPNGRASLRPGTGANGERPPSDWALDLRWPGLDPSPDGGLDTCTCSDQRQPDLNGTTRRCGPSSRRSCGSGSTRGVDGFRIDVAHGLAKDLAHPLRDLGEAAAPVMIVGGPDHPHWDRDDVHEIYRSWAGCSMPTTRRGSGSRGLGLLAGPPRRLRAPRRSSAPGVQLRLPAGPVEAAAAARGHRPVAARLRSGRRDHDPGAVQHRRGEGRHPLPPYDARLGLRRPGPPPCSCSALPGSAYLYQGERARAARGARTAAAGAPGPSLGALRRHQPGRDGSRVPLPGSRPARRTASGRPAPGCRSPRDWGRLCVQARTAWPARRSSSTVTRSRCGAATAAAGRCTAVGPRPRGARVSRGDSGLVCTVNLGTAPERGCRPAT